MEGVLSSIRENMEGLELASVVEGRRLEQSLFFPDLRHHPRCAALDKLILDGWTTSYGDLWAAAIDKMRASEISSLGAYFWPNSSDDKRASTLFKLVQWFTLVDDAYGDLDNGTDAHRLCNQLIQDTFQPGLACPPPMIRSSSGQQIHHEKQPLITAVGLEWWQEMQRTVSPTQRARFIQEFCKHLREQAQEVVFRETYMRSNKLPDLEEYILMRRTTSGFSVCITMVEYDLGIELDEDKLQNPQLRKLQKGITDLACWINDILSFPKEIADGELLNLLSVLHMHNIDSEALHRKGRREESTVRFEDAVSQAWRLVEAREQECAALACALRRHDHSPSLHKYVEAACGIASGVWAWTLQSPRYKVSRKKESVTNSDYVHHCFSLSPNARGVGVHRSANPNSNRAGLLGPRLGFFLKPAQKAQPSNPSTGIFCIGMLPNIKSGLLLHRQSLLPWQRTASFFHCRRLTLGCWRFVISATACANF